jgi:hypothetical protein
MVLPKAYANMNLAAAVGFIELDWFVLCGVTAEFFAVKTKEEFKVLPTLPDEKAYN